MSEVTNGAPPARIADFTPLPAGRDQYPLEFIEKHGVVKLSDTAGAVVIGVTDATDRVLLERLRSFHGATVSFRRVDGAELAAHLGREASQMGAAASERESDDERLLLDRLANDAPIVNLVNNLLLEAVTAGASDVHVEPFADEVRVRYRLDGVLQTVRRLERSWFAGIASRVKVMANLNIMERRRPQDGRISVELGRDTIDLRVSIVPTVDGESIVMRLFSRRSAPLLLDEVGLSQSALAQLRSVFRVPHGLLLATGPTGSGKTTTLNAVLREIRSDELKIVTIEDPIEYAMPGIDQIQTNERIGLTFESLLRRVLRQDPDVLMVGEIRDLETAELAVRAALTGHLVLSTLHTNDAVSVVSRLRNMGLESYLIAAVLKAAVAQRLVRRVCEDCRETRSLTPAEAAISERFGVEVGSVHYGTGCASCGQSGYRGRVAVFELLRIDERAEELIADAAPMSALREHVRQSGARSLIEDGLAKIAAGVTTFEELERVVVTS